MKINKAEFTLSTKYRDKIAGSGYILGSAWFKKNGNRAEIDVQISHRYRFHIDGKTPGSQRNWNLELEFFLKFSAIQSSQTDQTRADKEHGSRFWNRSADK